MEKTIFITAALPYANGVVHFGHLAGCYLPADITARFFRLKGNPVFFLCGSDEYGFAITLSAQIEGRTPQEHVDEYHKKNTNLFNKMDIAFDVYSRTTNPCHAPRSQEFFKKLLENGFIQKRTTEQLYSKEDGQFLADRYVVGTCPHCGYENARGDECPSCAASYEATDLLSPRSKVTGALLEKKETEHWFLLLDLFKEELEAFLSMRPWKSNVLAYAKNYAKNLKPRAITRDSEWGVKVPIEGVDGKVLYVWFDAPIGYISIAEEYGVEQGDLGLWQRLWKEEYETHLIQFLGKDNIPFHAVIFPAMLMGQKEGFRLVDDLVSNEFLMLEGKQFSKSEKWYIDLEEAISKYSSDHIRFALTRIAPETSDSEFRWSDFQQMCNSELVGKFGNFANRTLTLLEKHFDNKIPEENYRGEEEDFLDAKVEKGLKKIESFYSEYSPRRALEAFLELVQDANQYFDRTKPWILAKEGEMELLSTALYECAELLRKMAIVVYPILPDGATRLWHLLGYSESPLVRGWSSLYDEKIPFHQVLRKKEILFRKIEDQEIEEEKQKLFG